MRIPVKILSGLLIMTALATTTFAATLETEISEIKNTGTAEPDNIQTAVEKLNSDIHEFLFLSEKIDGAKEIDRDVLVYRLDVRSFRMLKDFEALVSEVTGLASTEPTKAKQLEAQLTELSEGVGDTIINRINEIEQIIAQSAADLDSLSGGSLVATRAYLQSIESMRIRYYEALVNYLESRKELGLSSERLRSQVDPKIKLYAEVLAGRIEFTGSALAQVKTRAKQAPNDTDIKAALLDLDARHAINLRRLETLIPVLDGLGLDSSKYKTVLLQQAGSISVSLFSSNALYSVLEDGWSALKSAVKSYSPDIIFRLLIFFAVLFVFRIFSRIVRRVVRVASDRSSLAMSDLLKNMLVSISGGTVMAIGVLMALSQIGISLAPMLAGLGVAGFIVGFALQDSLSNFAAGAMILVYRPFDVDDFVEVTGASGLVKKMNLVSTTIATFDNQTLVVPNSKIWGDVIKNVTAQKERRVDLEFGIGYGDDIEHAERVLHEIVTAHEKVLKQPEPNIRLHTLGDSSVNFIVRPWVKTEDYWSVYWDIMREVKLRFDREGISIPFPQRDVHLFKETEA